MTTTSTSITGCTPDKNTVGTIQSPQGSEVTSVQPVTPTPSVPPTTAKEVLTTVVDAKVAPKKMMIYDESAWANSLWVKADQKDISVAERSEAKKKLAGAIVHRIQETGECRLRCFGAHSIAKAVMASTIARGTLATYGYDLFLLPCFIDGQFDDKAMTGSGFIVVVSENEK